MVATSRDGSDRADGEGRLARISSLRRVWISGWVARRCVPHVNDEDVVSCLQSSAIAKSSIEVRLKGTRAYPAARKVNN